MEDHEKFLEWLRKRVNRRHLSQSYLLDPGWGWWKEELGPEGRRWAKSMMSRRRRLEAEHSIREQYLDYLDEQDES